MQPILWLKAVVLGLVEGATEFIPVSSTGHLILAGKWLAFEGNTAVAFDIFIQLGAILAVLWLYRAKVFGALGAATHDPAARRFLLNLLIAFLPAAIIGLAVHDFIEEKLFTPWVVACSLVVGGVVILLVERFHRPPTIQTVDEMKPGTALGIGFAQCLSLIPGVSRSASTIMSALALGTARVAATEFSFFLAIPVMFAASGYALLKSRHVLTAADIPVFAIGFIVSFVSALIVVKAFLRFVSHNSFAAFAWYRIVLGVVLLVVYWNS
jgi:undecaprenyl-diphosphatase